MDDKDYVTRFEYDERQKRIDDENNRQNHRLDKLETITDQIAEMAASIKAMVVTMQSMQKEQEEQGKRLTDIEKKQFLKSFVSEVHIFEKEQEDGRFLKRIKFHFPVFLDGREVQELDWDNESTVETVCLLSKKA